MHFLKSLFLFFCAFLLFCGCATVVSSPQQVTEATKTRFDPYDQAYTISGMKLNLGGFPNITRVWMRGGFDKTGGREFIQLYVYHWSQTGWNFFSQASDISGAPLVVHQIDREVERKGNVQEHVSIDLPREYLEQHKATGLNIRLLGSKGYLIIEIPSAYIIGFLEKYDSSKKSYGEKKGE